MRPKRTPLQNSKLILILVTIFAVASIFCSYMLSCSSVSAEEGSVVVDPVDVVSEQEADDEDKIDCSVAVVKVYGVLSNSNSMMLLSKLRWVRDDNTVKGVILRINSPGGGVHITESAYRILQQIKVKGKPTIAVLERGAFSGGYYLAAGCDRIVSNRSTLTGSIGVIWGGMNYSGFMNRVGVQDTSITSGRNKTMGSSTLPMTDEQKLIIKEIVMDAYLVFSGVVVTNRPKSRKHSRVWSDGRVVTTPRAIELGLVDSIGYFEDSHRWISDKLDMDELVPLWNSSKNTNKKNVVMELDYSGVKTMLWYHL